MIAAYCHLSDLSLQRQHSGRAEAGLLQGRAVGRHPEVFANREDAAIGRAAKSHSAIRLNRVHVRVQHAHHECGPVVPSDSLIFYFLRLV